MYLYQTLLRILALALRIRFHLITDDWCLDWGRFRFFITELGKPQTTWLSIIINNVVAVFIVVSYGVQAVVLLIRLKMTASMNLKNATPGAVTFFEQYVVHIL